MGEMIKYDLFQVFEKRRFLQNAPIKRADVRIYSRYDIFPFGLLYSALIKHMEVL